MMIMAKINNKTRTGRKKAGLISDSRGLSTVEYLILLVVIAVAGIAIWKQLGATVKSQAETSDTALKGL